MMKKYDDEHKIRVTVITLGCKVNKYESDSMKGKLADAGFLIVEPDDVADFYIVNTCSVTNMAERKSRQMLRRAKKRNPEAKIIAAGCYVNADREGLIGENIADIIIGNNCKADLIDIINAYTKDSSKNEKYVDMSEVSEYEEIGNLNITYLDHKRAYIKIQDGCNQFCSYCIIPYTRGRVRSREKESILEEIRGLADSGIKEFVLTGIHISSYGSDFDGKTRNNEDLAGLINAISDIDNVYRIRLGSLEPRIITEEFLDRINKDKLCPHFHLSLQSGCDDTLKRMNRHYTVGEFKEKCDILRTHFNKPAITTDVIVGFPGESDKEFETTVSNLEKLKLYEIHVFKYSVRNGTMAAKMDDMVSEEEKNKRSDALIALTARQKKEYEKSIFGEKDEVLIEEAAGTGKYVGHTKRYVKVEVSAKDDIVNQIVPYTYK